MEQKTHVTQLHDANKVHTQTWTHKRILPKPQRLETILSITQKLTRTHKRFTYIYNEQSQKTPKKIWKYYTDGSSREILKSKTTKMNFSQHSHRKRSTPLATHKHHRLHYTKQYKHLQHTSHTGKNCRDNTIHQKTKHLGQAKSTKQFYITFPQYSRMEHSLISNIYVTNHRSPGENARMHRNTPNTHLEINNIHNLRQYGIRVHSGTESAFALAYEEIILSFANKNRLTSFSWTSVRPSTNFGIMD